MRTCTHILIYACLILVYIYKLKFEAINQAASFPSPLNLMKDIEFVRWTLGPKYPE